ncbi:MAG TPA: hypothetical protein VG603_01665 [Chitinophagales bacterium]|nr:hypothetical protein [Chitinophagales bacterium]
MKSTFTLLAVLAFTLAALQGCKKDTGSINPLETFSGKYKVSGYQYNWDGSNPHANYTTFITNDTLEFQRTAENVFSVTLTGPFPYGNTASAFGITYQPQYDTLSYYFSDNTGETNLPIATARFYTNGGASVRFIDCITTTSGSGGIDLQGSKIQ